MARKKTRRAITVGKATTARALADLSEPPPEVVVRTLSQITPRAHGDTRRLDAAHVAALAESIDALGLLEPLVVDNRDRLLAGGHRLAACLVLDAPEGERGARLAQLCDGATPALMTRVEEYDGRAYNPHRTPVRVVDFDSTADDARALAIETAENAQRKQYSGAEVRALIERLTAAGYSHTKGRPAAGVKALRPALSAVLGLSMRQTTRKIREVLSDAEEERRDRESLKRRLRNASRHALRSWGEEEALALLRAELRWIASQRK